MQRFINFVNMEIIINPLKGIFFKEKEIVFGMTQQKVELLLGPPTSFHVNNLINQIHEPRNGAIFKYENNNLFSIEIPINSGLKVLFKDIEILNDKEAVCKLSKFDTPTPDNGKYMNFYKLGILLGGFGKKRIPEKKIVIVFPKDKIEYYEMMFKIGGGKL